MISRQSHHRLVLLPRLGLLLIPLIIVIIGSLRASPAFQTINTLGAAPLRVTATPTPTKTTAPRDDAQALMAARAAIGPDFSSYYGSHKGATWLGDAITPEETIAQGTEQVFQGGILRIANGGNSQVATVPLVSALINAGALMPLAGSDPGPSLTYATLASATTANQRVAAPWWWHTGSRAVISGIFVPQGSQTGTALGHYIPALFATYLTNLGNWQSILGVPLSEALPVTATVQGAPHQYIMQVFDRGILYYDQTQKQVTPQILTQTVGADYLAIFGPPTVTVKTAIAWTNSSPTTIMAGPGGTLTAATFFSPFPVTLLGDSIWLDGVLWEHVQWQNLNNTRAGWIKQSQLTADAPSDGAAQSADLSALAPNLDLLATQQQQSLAVAVYVPEYGRTYAYNPGGAIVMGSTFKIPILLTLLKQAETQGRSLTANEENLATAMIENSDNDAASALYTEINYDTGVYAFLQSINVSGIQINTDGFGYSTTTPVAMIQLLNALWDGHILSDSDRQFALDLMSHVEADQQMGVGTTAPANATFAMKDGWIDDDSGWVNDSVGIVTSSGHTYLIAVYSNGHDTLDGGWQPVETVCGDIANELGE